MTSFQKLAAAAAASNATVHEVSVTKRKDETVLSNNTVDAAARHPPLTSKLHPAAAVSLPYVSLAQTLTPFVIFIYFERHKQTTSICN